MDGRTQDGIGSGCFGSGLGENCDRMILVAQHFNQIEVSDKNRLGEPWLGAWKVLKDRS